jgi:hypothetical protein
MIDILLNSTIVLTVIAIWIHLLIGVVAILWSDKHYPDCVVQQTDSLIGIFVVAMIWFIAIPICIRRYKQARNFNHLDFKCPECRRASDVSSK